MTSAVEHLSSAYHPGVLVHLSRFTELRVQFQQRRGSASAPLAKFERTERSRQEFAVHYARMIQSFMDGDDCHWRIQVYCTDRAPNRAVFFANDMSPEAEPIVTRFPNASPDDAILCVSTERLDALSKMSNTAQLVEASSDLAFVLSINHAISVSSDFEFNAILSRALFQGVAMSGSVCAGRFLTHPLGAGTDHFETMVSLLLSEYLNGKAGRTIDKSDQEQAREMMTRYAFEASLLMSLDDVFRDDVGNVAHHSTITSIIGLANDIVSGLPKPRAVRMREAA